MAPRPAKSAATSALPEGDPGSVLRRAPFSDNPKVGARGQRAQHRILDAALQVFGDVGYHECGVLRITEVAGCSRAAFYQYFSSKEDVFRYLAGLVARQLTESAEALGPVTADAVGWEQLRAWIGRHGEIYDTFEPMFRVFQAAAESDELVARGAGRTADRSVAIVRDALVGSPLASKQLDTLLALLLESMSRTHHVAGILQRALPVAAYPRDRVDDALADITHRALLGFDPEVNVHPPARKRPPQPTDAVAVLRRANEEDGANALSPTGARTMGALLEAGHELLVARGFHGTRVDDIATAAGVSHGAFYRYFENKEHLVRVLGLRAMRTVSTNLADIPDVAGDPGPATSAALRNWLRRYNRAHSAATAMFRVWVDAPRADRGQRLESAAALDWGRRRMVRVLAPRGFGDTDTEALVLVGFLEAFGSQRRSAAEVEAAALLVERGFLGRS